MEYVVIWYYLAKFADGTPYIGTARKEFPNAWDAIVFRNKTRNRPDAEIVGIYNDEMAASCMYEYASDNLIKCTLLD